jgi:hypothetical protein
MVMLSSTTKATVSSLMLLFSVSSLQAENRILDVKTGYCITIQQPVSMAGSSCFSQVYYFRESNKNIYICGVAVGFKPPTSAISQVPTEIGCHSLGKAPISGKVSMRSLGDRLNAKEYIQTGELQYSMFSWRGAYWLVSEKEDALTFCVWSKDGSYSPSPVGCVTQINWNKYVPSGAVGGEFRPGKEDPHLSLQLLLE